MRYRNNTPYHEEVRLELHAHLKKYGFTAFRDECYLARYEGEGLSIEWGSEGGTPVHIPEYENALADWRSGYENPSPTEDELYQMELEMNIEHIGVMVRNAERDY